MNTITKPLGLTFIISILIFLCNFINYAAMANFIGLTLILLFFTLLIHELGHVLFGIWSGYRFNYLTMGPLTVENTEHIKIKVNDNWLLVGGVASCSPLSSELTSIAKWIFLCRGTINKNNRIKITVVNMLRSCV